MTYEERIDEEGQQAMTAREEVSADQLVWLRRKVVELVNQTTDEQELFDCINVLNANKNDSLRSDISRGISGEEVMARLRPKLKQLFQ